VAPHWSGIRQALPARRRRRCGAAQSFELPQRVHLEPELWAPENGWLTPTFKFRRDPLRKRYQAAIDAMYADMAASGGKPATL
jgi:long-subunit acyl-CoA synthetase (AMP-forming)